VFPVLKTRSREPAMAFRKSLRRPYFSILSRNGASPRRRERALFLELFGMRTLILATGAALGLFAGAGSLASQTAQITQLPYPAEVSLVQEQMGWTYRQSSNNLPLYLYEPASAETHCTAACERQWVPLLAPSNEKPLGDWTIFVRGDGRAQWAFQQHPVYTHLHDTPSHAAGPVTRGAWHPMPHFAS
jgi:predicted lipoprotein with Yx(FWY)xxD motif